jgi:hypothetical protein
MKAAWFKDTEGNLISVCRVPPKVPLSGMND